MDYRLLYLAVGTFAISTVGFSFAGLLPSISVSMHVSVAHAGMVITAYSLAYAIGAPILSATVGAMDRRYILCAAMLVFVFGNILAAFTGSFATLVASQALMGAAAGLFVSTAQVVALSLVGPEHRARAVSFVFTGSTFAVALGAPLGSLIAGIWSWRETFLCTAAIGSACAVLMWMQLPRDMPGTRLSLGQRLGALSRPGIPSSLTVTMLSLVGGFIIIAYLAPLAMEGAGLGELALPAVLLAFGIGAVVGNLASGYLADRLGATRVAFFSLAGGVPLALALSLVTKMFSPEFAGPALIAIMFVWGILGWAFPPAQASRLGSLAPDVPHLTLSLNISALYFGVAIGTFIGGRVLEYATVTDLGFVSAVFSALAVLALAGSGRAARRAAAARPAR